MVGAGSAALMQEATIYEGDGRVAHGPRKQRALDGHRRRHHRGRLSGRPHQAVGRRRAKGADGRMDTDE